MGCEVFRELLSARLDGEDEVGRAGELDSHLAGCAACEEWLDRAARVTRLARTAPAETGPDLTEAVLDALPPRRASRWSAGLWPRWLLGAVGMAQAVLGAVTLLALWGGAEVGHVSRESGAWSLALGVAFGWVALRLRTDGLLPVLTTFTVLMVTVTALDLHSGHVEPVREASHLLTVAGLLLVLWLHRRYSPRPTGRAGDFRLGASARSPLVRRVAARPGRVGAPRHLPNPSGRRAA